ncbi:flagellar protein FlaG [Neobacillus citreus]|uniref:Flagellar protein FlaG n=1 Tax=Neobacillus citreus TaxID=2833578 RepID=A0A942Y7F6_9BACI|nr:flagellar protein FlaG [Neobacillus citreus]MCH6263908.1 flagellar protein FlaG [Neobacillus citreus]
MLDKLTAANSSFTKKVEQVESISKVKEVTPDKQNPLYQGQDLKEKTEKVIESINQFLKESNTHLKFRFHDELKEFYVAIVDDTTNEVVKEIPPKKMLDMYAAMTEYLGLLVDMKG